MQSIDYNAEQITMGNTFSIFWSEQSKEIGKCKIFSSKCDMQRLDAFSTLQVFQFNIKPEYTWHHNQFNLSACLNSCVCVWTEPFLVNLSAYNI